MYYNRPIYSHYVCKQTIHVTVNIIEYLSDIYGGHYENVDCIF